MTCLSNSLLNPPIIIGSYSTTPHKQTAFCIQQYSQKQQSTTTDEEENNNTVREELIEIYAPAGKLGVILEESTLEGGGPPVVHGIRETSVLRNELLIGDRLIALDDEDVRKMPANKVSKMISKKMENATRKLSIIRTVRGGTGGGPVSSPGVSPAASADRSVGV